MAECETIVRLEINAALYRDAIRCAQEAEMEIPRFLTEIIEAYVATRRMRKDVPKIKLGTITKKMRGEE